MEYVLSCLFVEIGGVNCMVEQGEADEQAAALRLRCISLGEGFAGVLTS